MIKIKTYQLNQVWEEAGEKLTETLEKNKNTLLLLSGGSAVGMYGKLAEFLRGYGGKIAVGQVDERFQPGGESGIRNKELGKNIDINANAIWRTGLWEVCEERKIPYFTISQEGTVEEAARIYNATMQECMNEYTYKMAVLGIGEDGHTAGLIHGYSRLWDGERWVVGYKLNQSRIMNQELRIKDRFRQRITITPKALRELDYALVAAVGEEKKRALEKIVKDIKDANIDKTSGILIREIQTVDLFTDQTI